MTLSAAASEETDATRGFTARFPAAAAGLRMDALPEQALVRAEHCFLDFFGNTIAGSRDPAVAMLRAALAGEEGTPQAGLVGGGQRVPLRMAALVNGTAGHALDYDDNNLTMPGHVSVVVIPALLALAEHRHLDGAAIVTALVAAFDAGCAIGAALAPGHYERGFHATATIGALAAAAASARLIGLDAGGTARAIGIAATSAAGLKGMFGTMCKPFHAGRAAETGLFAALLAERGFTSAGDGIERRQGFADTHSPVFAPRNVSPAHGDRHIADNLFKFHAACYGTHAVIDAALELASRMRIDPTAITAMTLDVAASNDTVCNIAEPRTEAEARFSLRHVAAMALTGHDTADPDAYGEASLDDQVVTSLRRRTSVRLVPDRAITLADVTIELSDGGRHVATADVGVPDADPGREASRLSGKFGRLAGPLLGEPRSAALADRLLRLRYDADIAGLVAMSDVPQ